MLVAVLLLGPVGIAALFAFAMFAEKAIQRRKLQRLEQPSAPAPIVRRSFKVRKRQHVSHH